MWVRSPHISTHALTEGDCLHQYSFTCVSHFNSRPHGGRPFFFDCVPILPYFNSRPHGGRRFGLPDEVPFDYISTHALTEGDPDFFLFIIVNCISTHALTEGDVERVSGISVPPFQLTPSRRATVTYGDMSVSVPVFQLTPSRRATDGRNYESRSRKFQLTPSRRATKISAYSPDSLIFQLTPSRRATIPPVTSKRVFNISTHALTEGDYGCLIPCH